MTVLAGSVFVARRQIRQHRRDAVAKEASQLLHRVSARLKTSAGRNLTDPRNAVADLKAVLSPAQKLLWLDERGKIISSTPGVNNDSDDDVAESVNVPPRLATLLRSVNRATRLRDPAAEFSTMDEHLLAAVTRRRDERRLALVWDATQRLNLAAAQEATILNAVVAAWVCSALAVAAIAAWLTNRIKHLAELLTLSNQSNADRHQLMGLAERGDEIGYAAQRFITASDHQQQQLSLGRQREQKIRASAVQLSAMLQAMVEGVIAVDGEERVLFANEVGCRMLQVDPQKVNGRPVFELIRNTHFQEVVHEAVRQQQRNEIQFRMPRNEMFLSLSVSPISSGGAVLVFDDITEVQRLEKMRRDFVSGVSHELKTPLTVIQACTETLLDGAADDPETAKRFLIQISEQSDRLSGLIVRMLHLARVESGELKFEVQPVDLALVSRTIVRDMQPIVEPRRLQLDVCGPDELYVLADDQAVRTVLGNLVDNAVKYTPDGGTIQIRLSADDVAAHMAVSDTGVGIAASDQARVFERFFRVERDRNRQQGGTGLGLAIVKHLCQGMQADLSLTSTVGEGTSITVTFPFQKS